MLVREETFDFHMAINIYAFRSRETSRTGRWDELSQSGQNFSELLEQAKNQNKPLLGKEKANKNTPEVLKNKRKRLRPKIKFKTTNKPLRNTFLLS
jgi:hypothetical protein